MSNYGGYEDNPMTAEAYDLVPMYKDRPDVGFYLDMCRDIDGKILEVGCGTGRILIPAAEAGCEITGLDLSEYMLAKCRDKLQRLDAKIQKRVRLVKGNAVDFSLDDCFSLAIVPFRVFQHLIAVEDQIACLKRINRHLEMDGKLVLDVFQVNLDRISHPDPVNEVEDTPEFELPDGRRLRRSNKVVSVERSNQVSNVELIYYLTGVDGKTTRMVQAFPFRYFFRYEMEHLLARCGFDLISVYGDFEKSPLEDKSMEMIFTCRKSRDLA